MKKKETKRKRKLTSKNKNKKMNRKKILKYVLVTIVLGILVYFVTSFFTTLIMDAVTKSKESDGEHNVFENLETIKAISIQDFIDNFNKKLQGNGFSYHVQIEFVEKENLYKCVMDQENQIILYLEPLKVLQNQSKETLMMSAIFFAKEYQNQEEKGQLLKALLQANNQELTEDEITQLIERVEETENTTQEGDTATSEFFQFKGLEVSKKVDASYNSYRVGRIMEEGTL